MDNIKLINLVINDQNVTVPEGTTILQACEDLNVEVPVFCFHSRLAIAGNCRMCLVEVEKMPKPVASCSMPVSEGMVVKTNTPMIENARKGVLELLLINHPLDCPICDQGGECDLQDITVNYGRGCSRFDLNKRAVPEKYMGPLIKTMMNRCIHCTRCVRFSNEIAGVAEIGAIHRGEHTEITTLEKTITSELSGNLIDICPVGALTSKPYAFHGRVWELQKTNTIDVLDAVGSNIRVDSKGNKVMRILPRINDEINEEWISDKTRFSYDGLSQQRLDKAYHRQNGNLVPCSFDVAIEEASNMLSSCTGDQIAGLIGNQADVESTFALKLLMDQLQSPYRDCVQNNALYSTVSRTHYIFNTGIEGIEKADFILLCGVNPRIEAPLVNARIRKRTLLAPTKVCLIGNSLSLNYSYEHISSTVDGLGVFLNEEHPISKELSKAQNPIIILGEACFNRADTKAIMKTAQDIMAMFPAFQQEIEGNVIWNGFNILHNSAGRVGALDVGFVPSKSEFSLLNILDKCKNNQIKIVICIGVDELNMADFGEAFIIYIGSHGDFGAHRADIILPSTTYVEKSSLYVNTEGRVQETQKILSPPGDAIEEVEIIKEIFKFLKIQLPYNTKNELRQLIYKNVPFMSSLNKLLLQKYEPIHYSDQNIGDLSTAPFDYPVSNFYMTCPITRNSKNMANCIDEILKIKKEG